MRVHALAILGALALLGRAETAHAKKIAHYESEVTGTLISVNAAGRFVPVPDVTAKLSCVGPEELDRHLNRSCGSSIVVKRGGAVIAKASKGLYGVDIHMAGGNDSSVKLELLDIGDGASLLLLAQWEQKGDEEMRSTTDHQLFVIDGATLRQVYRYQALSTWTPGPDTNLDNVPPSALRTGIKIKRDGGRTQDVPNLVEASFYGPDDSPNSKTVLAWNGREYAACTACKPTPVRATATPPTPAKPPAPTPTPAPAPAPPDPMSLLDANTKGSIEPILGKVLRGERLTPEALKPLAAASLVRLRNAAYARHGRPFKSAELQSFFYGARADKSATTLLPLTANSAFTDSMLDDNDRANIKLVLAESRSRSPTP